MDHKTTTWFPDLILGASQRVKGVFDLNPYSLDCFLATPDGKAPPAGIWKEYCDQHADRFSPALHALANNLLDFVSKYAREGQTTVLRGVHAFLRFQAINGYRIASAEGIAEYATHLAHRIGRQKQTANGASGLLSNANKFLAFTGELPSAYHYEFGAGRHGANRVGPYSESGFEEFLCAIFHIHDACRDDIIKHIDRTSSGQRSFKIEQIHSVHKYKSADGTHEFDFICRNQVANYMATAFIIFSVFTWSNKQQATDLDASELSINEEGAETKLIYKGRAQKFIRLNIGKSSVEGDRSGLQWLNGFLDLRGKLVKYLLKHEERPLVGEPLFFAATHKKGAYRKFSAQRILKLSEHPLMEEARSRGVGVPRVDTRRIRKTCEQYADRIIKNPLVITEKAQHEWDTYKRNYAHGNPSDARIKMAEALKFLQIDGISAKSFSERQAIAADLGVSLEAPNENTHILLHGLGCKNHSSSSPQEKKFMQKQAHFGRTPAACADLANCVDCENCALVEDPEAIYNLLSFKQMILLSKSTYLPSTGAMERYESILEKIELRVSLVDKDVLAKATKRLNQDGPSETWLF